jgi:hypothetical protein
MEANPGGSSKTLNSPVNLSAVGPARVNSRSRGVPTLGTRLRQGSFDCEEIPLREVSSPLRMTGGYGLAAGASGFIAAAFAGAAGSTPKSHT